MLEAAHDAGYVSTEFPTFTTNPSNTLPTGPLLRYIVHCMVSPQYIRIIDAQSTGSTQTSRNRFNQRLFVDLPIRLPTNVTDLARAVTLLETAGAMRREQARLVDTAKAFWDSSHSLIPY